MRGEENMKRMFVLLMAVVLLCSAPVVLAEDALTIQEMRETAPARWEAQFETPWRTIDVDAEIVLPEVCQLPVVLVRGGATEPTFTAEEAGWDSVEYRGPYELILSNDGEAYPKSVDGKRVAGPVSKGSWYGDYDMDRAYIPLDDITLREIIEKARERTAQLGYGPDDFDWENPLEIWTHHLYAAGTEEDVLPGYMLMRVSPKVCGIPVLSHIYKATTDLQTNCNDELLMIAEANLCYDGYSDGLTSLFLCPLKVEETLAEDVPLCPLGKVLSSVEAEIDAGHIRKVYEIKLGYVLYNEPGVYYAHGNNEELYDAARYYAKPMWQINCLYVKRASGDLRDVSDVTDDERNSLDYCQLLIDAQTGEWVEVGEAKDRYAFKGFLSWDDVK